MYSADLIKILVAFLETQIYRYNLYTCKDFLWDDPVCTGITGFAEGLCHDNDTAAVWKAG